MTTTTQASAHADAYRTYRAAVRDAMEAHDPDLTTEAQGRRRAEAIRNARATLVAAIPPLPQDTVEGARERIVSARAPQTADQFAAFARQREKVGDLARQGYTFQQIVASADVTRLDALLDNLHVIPESEQQEIRDAIIDRLGELEVPEVVAVLEAEVELERTEAWHDALSALAQNGEAEYPSMVQLSRVDPDGYAANFPVEFNVDWATVERIAPAEVAR